MINLLTLKKDELQWLIKHKCRHNHRYIEHMNCFEEERDSLIDCPIQPERIGFLDIETLGLTANWGYIFSYCIKELDGRLYKRVLTPKEIRGYVFDNRLLQDFNKDIKYFDRVIVYWGKDRRHDLPFLRSRALRWKVDFPLYREVYVTDLYDMVKAKLKLHNNRLMTACRFLKIPVKQHPLEEDIWLKAMAGHKQSLDYIGIHNEEDVISTEALWKKLHNFTRASKTSI